MIDVMLDSDDPAVLLESRFAGLRIATYADLITPAILSAAAGRLIAIDRGLGDPHRIATVADIEAGADSIANGAAKLHEWHNEGRPFVTAYHDRAIWGEVIAALGGLAVHHWTATLDGTANPDGQYPAVVQILPADKLGFHADLSIVWNTAWHPGPTPPTPAQVAGVKAALSTFLGSGPALQRLIEAL